MNDNFFLDRDGTPLTGKIPLQISLQGDCNALRSQANSELTTFLTDLRLSGLPQMRRTTQLIGGTMEMVHTYGVTQVALSASTTKTVKEPEFWGGFVMSLLGRNSTDTRDTIVHPDATTSGATNLLPGRPAVPGTKPTDVTNAIVIQVHPTANLADQPIKKGVVKIWRIKDPGAGEVCEIPYGRNIQRFLLSTNIFGTKFYFKGKQVTNIPAVPSALVPHYYLFPSNELGEYSTPQRLLQGVMITYGLDYQRFDKSKALKGIIALFTNGALLAIDLNAATPAWARLDVFFDDVRTVRPIGRSVSITEAGGAAEIVLSQTGCSTMRVNISNTRAITGALTWVPRGAEDATGTGTVTVSGEYKTYPQAETTDEFTGWEWKWALVSGTTYQYDAADPIAASTRRVKYKAYGFETKFDYSYVHTGGHRAEHFNPFTGVVRPAEPIAAASFSWSWRQQCTDFKGYHYRIKGYERVYNSLTGQWGMLLENTARMANTAISESLYSYTLTGTPPATVFVPHGDPGDPTDPDPKYLYGYQSALLSGTHYYDRANPNGAYKYFSPDLGINASHEPTVARPEYVYYYAQELSGTFAYPPLAAPSALHSLTPSQFSTQPLYGPTYYFEVDSTATFGGSFCLKDGEAGLANYPGFPADGVDFVDYTPTMSTSLPTYPNEYAVAGTYPKWFSQQYPRPETDIAASHIPGFPTFPFSKFTDASGTADLALRLKSADRCNVAAYPKRAAVFGFTETLTTSDGRFSMSRSGDVVADEHLAQLLPTNISTFPTIVEPTTTVSSATAPPNTETPAPWDQDISLDSFAPDHHAFTVGLRANPKVYQQETNVYESLGPAVTQGTVFPTQSGRADYRTRLRTTNSFSPSPDSTSAPHYYVAHRGKEPRASQMKQPLTEYSAQTDNAVYDPLDTGDPRYLCLNPRLSSCPSLGYRTDTPTSSRLIDYTYNTVGIGISLHIMPEPILQVAYLGRNTTGDFPARRLRGGVSSNGSSPSPDVVNLDTLHQVESASQLTPETEKSRAMCSDMLVDVRSGAYIYSMIGNQTSEVSIAAVLAEWRALGATDGSPAGLTQLGTVSPATLVYDRVADVNVSNLRVSLI